MKTFRISFTIQDGDNEYGDALTVKAGQMSGQDAARYLFTEFYYYEDWEEMSESLLAGEECWLDIGRIIKDLAVEEIPPILITVEGGVIQSIDNIPPDITVVVRDFDADDPGHPQVRRSPESGDPYQEEVWEG
jgi:hypothetical protein